MFLDRIPIRFRLALGHALGMALLFLGIGFGIFRLVETHLYDSVDAALITSAQSIRDARFVRGFNSPLMQQFLDAFVDDNEKTIRPYAQLVDFSGRVSARSANMRITLPVTPLAIARAEKGLPTIETMTRKGSVALRQITIPVLNHGRFTGELVQVGTSLAATQHTLRGISIMLWSALPVGLCLSVFFGYYLTRRSLFPVVKISRAAAKLGADDLNLRLPLPRADDELRKLTVTFNGMLDRLQDAFSRLRRFAGDVSHELRTPLAVLRGEAELALRRERKPEEYRAALRTIAAEANNMTKMVEELLLLARAQSKAVAFVPEEVQLRVFLEKVLQSLQIEADCKEATLVLDCEPELIIQASPTYLEIAVKNLVRNALKHSPTKSRVEVKGYRLGTDVAIDVVDKGEGIPSDSLPYIFDPFFRVDSARNRSAGGTGLGLGLARALVQLHGGDISVESTVGVGSTFSIVVPRDAKTVHKEKVVSDKSSREQLIASVPASVAAYQAPQPN